LPKAIDYLNNYPTCLIREPGSLKWGLASSVEIILEKVESRPFIKSKRLIRKNKEILKKGDSVCYLLANAKWEGSIENQRRITDPIWSPSLHKIWKLIVLEDEPVLYYLDGEYVPTCRFVREELMYLDHEPELPLQGILASTGNASLEAEEKVSHSRSIHIVHTSNSKFKGLVQAEDYAKK
jgi:hypothetical protein